MFIVKKEIKGKEYFYLRQSVREGGKVKAKTLAYLGKTKKEAEEKAKEFKLKTEKKEMVETKIESKEITIDELANFCKRKGFIYPSADIYGGLAGFWDYGPI